MLIFNDKLWGINMFVFFKRHDFRRVLNRFFSLKLSDEIFIILFFALATFLGISFFSYNNLDSSFLYFSSDKINILNFCGRVGANLSAFFFYYFGLGGYLLIFLPLLLGFIKLYDLKIRAEYLRLVGFAGFIFALSSIAAIADLSFLNIQGGGLFGFIIAKFLSFYFNIIGSYLLLFLFVFISAVVIFKISLVSFLSSFINAISYFVSKLFSKLFYSFKSISYGCYSLDEESFDKGFFSDLCASGPISFELEYFLETLVPYMFYRVPSKDDIFMANRFSDQFVPASMVIKTDLTLRSISAFLDDRLKILVMRFSSFKICAYGSKPKFYSLGKWQFKRILNSVLNKNLFNFIKTLYKEEFENSKLESLSLNFNDKVSTQNTSSEESLAFEPKIEYDLPDLSIFENNKVASKNKDAFEAECKEQARKLEEKLFHFGVNGKVTAIRPGPIITLFEYAPDIDTKISKITALEDDLALALKAMSIRILAPIPGRAVIGFEISNQSRETVLLSDILLSDQFRNNKASLPIVLGVDIVGTPLIEDLVAMPHLLIAGSTGSGKSVGLNAMLVSLLCKLTPQQLKLILVDPKRLEFATYSDIPHLLFPIITDARKVSLILKWVVSEMDRRYSVMANCGVRNLFDYYSLYKSKGSERSSMEHLPWMAIIIDELADVMMVAGKEVEFYITRIAQMARAAGIHMIVATQRPSVDVVTGIIKVNFPSRIGYRVSSKIDSKTILDSSGAEKLLGKGDLLYLNPKGVGLERIHGPYISDKEIKVLTDYLRSQKKAQYLDINEITIGSSSDSDFDRDELYEEIVNYVKTIDEISISMLQRKYRIGFNRSARLIEQLEKDGILAPAQGSKPRKVLRM